jgi:hypothetical protein
VKRTRTYDGSLTRRFEVRPHEQGYLVFDHLCETQVSRVFEEVRDALSLRSNMVYRLKREMAE